VEAGNTKLLPVYDDIHIWFNVQESDGVYDYELTNEDLVNTKIRKLYVL